MYSSSSGLVVKSNVAIVRPRVRFSAGADFIFIGMHVLSSATWILLDIGWESSAFSVGASSIKYSKYAVLSFVNITRGPLFRKCPPLHGSVLHVAKLTHELTKQKLFTKFAWPVLLLVRIQGRCTINMQQRISHHELECRVISFRSFSFGGHFFES